MSEFDPSRPRLALEACEGRLVPTGGPYTGALADLAAAQAGLTGYVSGRAAAGRPADPAANATLVQAQQQLVTLTTADAGRTAAPPAGELAATVEVGSDLTTLLDRLVRTTDGPDCTGELKQAYVSLTRADNDLTATLTGRAADDQTQADVATEVGTHAVLVGLLDQPFPDGCGSGSGSGSGSDSGSGSGSTSGSGSGSESGSGSGSGSGSTPGSGSGSGGGSGSGSGSGSRAPGGASVPGLRLTAVGAGQGGGPRVQVYNPDGSRRFDFFAFDSTLRTGVRVATGDITGDGVDDIVTVTGPGARAEARVFDGATGAPLTAFRPFEDGFTGGGYVAVAELDDTGRGRVAVSAAEGGGPRVTVFDGNTGAVTADFFALDDTAFRGGVRVTAGDLDGDRAADLVATAGAGGGPVVSRFSGAALLAGRGAMRMGGDFFAFDPMLRNGATATVADVTGAAASLVVGGGPDGRRVSAAPPTRPDALPALAFDAGFDGQSDVRVSADGGSPGLVVGFGPGSQSRVLLYTSTDLARTAPAASGRSFVAFESTFLGGVYIG